MDRNILERSQRELPNGQCYIIDKIPMQKIGDKMYEVFNFSNKLF